MNEEEQLKMLKYRHDYNELGLSRLCVKKDREIEKLNNIIIELSEKNRNLIEDNMRLRKEINLHSGKLCISDIEVKEVWK